MVAFALVWLGPITWVGSLKRDVYSLPAWVRHQQRIACLFTGSVSTWKTYHVEVRFGDDPAWVEYEPEEFEMEVFGYRSRLHRLLGHSYRKTKGDQRIRDVSYYIKANYDKAHPLGPPMTGLRFVSVSHGVELLAGQDCKFKKPRLDELDKSQRVYRFGEIDFKNPKPLRGQLRRDPRRRPVKKSDGRPLPRRQP